MIRFGAKSASLSKAVRRVDDETRLRALHQSSLRVEHSVSSSWNFEGLVFPNERGYRVFSKELLAIERLTLRRGRLRRRWFHHALDQEDLVDDVSFTINRRSFLVGEEKSGKLAITMALLKLHPVASGRIVFGVRLIPPRFPSNDFAPFVVVFRQFFPTALDS